jgi:hypothetical protein
MAMLGLLSTGVANEADLLEHVEDLHVLRQLCAEGYVVTRENEPLGSGSLAANRYFELTGAGETELRRSR